jgi:Protein of unknown function (DUF2950)
VINDGQIYEFIEGQAMRRESTQTFAVSDWTKTAVSFVVAFAVLIALALMIANRAQGQSASGASASGAKVAPKSAQAMPHCKTFASPQEAADALSKAARDNDESAILVILGPAAKDIVAWTDDPAQRKAEREMFVKKYDEMHRFVREPDTETTLYVGAENWPLPVPLVHRAGVWYFDADLGRSEILYRRIGQNEMETMDTLRAVVDAENDHFSRDISSSGDHEYARKFNCSEGTHDGLYWPTSGSDDSSPAGPLVARASVDASDRAPFRGYYFRILTAQGAAARGGARSYVVDGKMTGGFAILAFPAEFRASGVKSFIVSQDGAIYEKSLGPSTAKLAAAITAFNPDSSWSKVQ